MQMQRIFDFVGKSFLFSLIGFPILVFFNMVTPNDCERAYLTCVQTALWRSYCMAKTSPGRRRAEPSSLRCVQKGKGNKVYANHIKNISIRLFKFLKLSKSFF